MNAREMTAEYRLQHWTEVIHECKQSGLRVKAYCESAGINPNRYFYWQKRLRDLACEEVQRIQGRSVQLAPSGFTEVKLAGQQLLSTQTLGGQSQISIEIPGVRLLAGGDYPIDKLTALLREARRPC